MQGTFFNCLLSAVVGAASAAGTVWYLSANSTAPTGAQSSADASSARNLRLESLEVGDLIIEGKAILVDPETKTATIELSDGSIVAQRGVYAEKMGAFRVLGQKLQTTPDNPLDLNSPVFGEIAINEDGGAYLALLSPRESHSVTIGFDKNEKGCVLSKNNDDKSMVAQAIFLRPSASDAETPATAAAEPEPQPAPTAESAPVEESVADTASETIRE